MITDEVVERAAKALERSMQPQWTDEQFDMWWNHDPFFTVQIATYFYFQGTRKARVLWMVRTVLEAAEQT